MESVDVIKCLAALAHPLRLQVFRALVVAGQSGLTPGVMQEGLGVPAATLSFHLKELAASGLATQERASRNLVYRAAYDNMNALLGYLTENCCQGAVCAPTAGAEYPGGAEGSDENKSRQFADAGVNLRHRIESMLSLPLADLDAMSLPIELKNIDDS